MNKLIKIYVICNFLAIIYFAIYNKYIHLYLLCTIIIFLILLLCTYIRDKLECKKNLLRIIIHEAGHAIVAIRCSYASDISININNSKGGVTKYKIYEDAWSKAVICISGIVAELIVCKNIKHSINSGNDLYKLRKALPLINNYQVAKRKFPIHDWNITYDKKLTNDELKKINDNYITSRFILNQNINILHKLIKFLIKNNNMNEEQVNNFVRENIHSCNELRKIFLRIANKPFDI